MNRYCFLIIILFTLINAHAIELGDELPKDAGPAHFPIQISSSTSAPAYYAKENGILYIVALDAKKKVTYIATDSNELRVDDIKVGDSLDKVKRISGKPLIADKNCEYYITLVSGWNASFAVADINPDTFMKELDNDKDVVIHKICGKKVTHFFKRQ